MEVFNTEQQCRDYMNSVPREPNMEDNKITLFPMVFDIESLKANLINAKASENVMKCVEFVFKRYRTGVYISYYDGLYFFISFMNLETDNEYSEYLELDPFLVKNIPTIVNNINKTLQQKDSNTKYIIKDNPEDWYVTNFLVKIEEYISDTPEFVTFYFYELYIFFLQIFSDPDFITSMTGKRLDFIVNHKDQNLLRIDNTDPMFHIVNPPKNVTKKFDQPFTSAEFSKICPILSFCKHVDYLDIPIPTPDDIVRVMKLYTPPDCKTSYKELWEGEEVPLPHWSIRTPIAVFRGSSTGWGLNSRTNPRMKISKLSEKNPNYLDAGITKIVRRYKKIFTEKFIKTNDTRDIKRSSFLSYSDQANYKYQVYIEGNVAAYRLGAMFGSGSLILLVKSDYKLWFEPLLKENVHYIPVKSDLSDLIRIISWCQNNDKICEQIAMNGKNFYDKFLKVGMFDYTKRILQKIAVPI